MTGNNLRKADSWLRTARNDLEAARFLANGRFWSLSCFMCQQAAEKTLNAFLRAHGETMHGSHGLATLCYRCLEHDPGCGQLMQACRRLGRYYIPTRYPDALRDDVPVECFTAEDASAAIADAQAIVAAVEEKLTSLAAGC